MMYQPTNITPSTLTGDSTIDVADNVKITWQINGDTPLEAFQIDFYNNDATSTLIHSTGLLTDDCPASGIDGQGKPVLFNYKPLVPWSTYGLANGQEYKYNIRQFWNEQVYQGALSGTPHQGTGNYYIYMKIGNKYYCNAQKNVSGSVAGGSAIMNNDIFTLKSDYSEFMVQDSNHIIKGFIPVSVLTSVPADRGTTHVYEIQESLTNYYDWLNQYSDNVFLTRTAPTLTIDAFTTPLDKIVNTFTATYTQAEGDSVKWVRWELINNTQSKTVADTGEINTYVFSYTYDGFMNDENYTLNCYAETENGVPVMASVTFDVSYQMPQAEGEIKLLCNSDSSVTLSWAQASDIIGEATDPEGYSINDNVLTLNNGNDIIWDTKNGQSLSIPTPQSIAYKGYQQSFINYGYDITLNTPMIDPIIALNPQGTLMVAAEGTTAELYSVSANSVTFLSKIYMDGISQDFDDIINDVCFSEDDKFLWIVGDFSLCGVAYNINGQTLSFKDNMAGLSNNNPIEKVGVVGSAYFMLEFTGATNDNIIIVYKNIVGGVAQVWTFPRYTVEFIKIINNGSFIPIAGGSFTEKGQILTLPTAINIEDNGTALTNPVTSAVYIGDDNEGYLICKTSYTNSGVQCAKLIWYYYNGTTYSYYYTLDTDYVSDGFELNNYNKFIFTGSEGLFEFRTDQIGKKLGTSINTFTPICPIYKDNNNTVADAPNEICRPYFSICNTGMVAQFNNLGDLSFKYYVLNDTISSLTILNENAERLLQRNIFNGISVMGSNLTNGYSAYQPFGNFSKYIWQIYYNNNWYLRVYSIGNNAINYAGYTTILNYNMAAIENITITNKQTVDYIYITNNANYDITQNNYIPLYTAQSQFYANFADGLQAGTNTTAAGNYAVYREQNGTSLLPFGLLSTTIQQMKDYGVLNNNTYSYSMYYVDNDTYSTPLYSDGVVCREFPAYVLMETTPDPNYSNVYHVLNVWCFGNNLEAQPVSNGNEPNFLENFTQYPYRQGSCVMALSGVLSALLSNAHEGQYADTAEQMERLYNISLSKNTFFLKDTKGNMFQVHTSNAITQTVNITTAKQEVKITIPWQEVGSADNVAVIQLPTDEGWIEEEGSESGVIKTQEKTVLLDMANGDQTITPDTNYLLNGVTVKKPNTLKPSNIIKDVNIGGVIGTVDLPILQTKTYQPTDPNNNVVLTPDEGYDGFNEVTISPALLMSIQRGASQVEQIITAPSPYYGLSRVVIPPARLKNITVKSSIDGMTYVHPVPFGYYGYGEISVQGISLQDKTVGLQITSQTVTADAGYDGLSEVTVNGIGQYWEPEIYITPNNTEQYITPTPPKLCIGAVTVGAVPEETKTVTITKNGTTTLTPTGGKWISQADIIVNVRTETQTGSGDAQLNDPSYYYPDAGNYFDEFIVNPIFATELNQTITQNGTYNFLPSDVDDLYDYFTEANITVNVQPVETKDYNFFDWDGTLVYSYTAAEINALTELPALPVHEGVSGKEWNYTLAQLQTLASLTTPYPANIGAIYSAPDGYSTIIWIDIPDSDTVRDFQIKWSENTQRDVDIDWGDTATETKAAASSVTATHTYSASGKYKIVLTPADSTVNVITIPTDATFLGANYRQKRYVKKVVVGRCYQSVLEGHTGAWFRGLPNLEKVSYGYNNSTALPRNSLTRATKLKALHIPSWITSVGVNHVTQTNASVITVPYNCTTMQYEAFASNPALTYFMFPYRLTTLNLRLINFSNVQKLVLPPNVTTIGTNTFSNTNIAFTEIILPENLSNIEASAFSLTNVGMYGMYIPYIYIPAGVTSIGSDAFKGRIIHVMDLRNRQTMPTLGNASAVNGVEVFVVDDDAYDAAIVATNWATYANKFVKASDYNA